MGVSRDFGVMTSAVRIAPRLVCFSAHATWWNFGEVECFRLRFLDVVTREDIRIRVAVCGGQ